jgi:hypothetical protein
MYISEEFLDSNSFKGFSNDSLKLCLKLCGVGQIGGEGRAGGRLANTWEVFTGIIGNGASPLTGPKSAKNLSKIFLLLL